MKTTKLLKFLLRHRACDSGVYASDNEGGYMIDVWDGFQKAAATGDRDYSYNRYRRWFLSVLSTDRRIPASTRAALKRCNKAIVASLNAASNRYDGFPASEEKRARRLIISAWAHIS